MRKITIVKNYLKHAEGSCMFSLGKTKVLCVATVEEKVPPFIETDKKEQGWITAEYSMMPRSCPTRISRKKLQNGRAQEISRLVGRALRACVDLEKLGKRTITIDCDVIIADGGTRTASINGGFVALVLALKKLQKAKLINSLPLKGFLGAISVGFVGNKMVLDLSAKEDNVADIDMNVVMLDNGELVEVQGTAEGHTFSREDLDKMLDSAKIGINKIIELQKKTLGKI